jgi:hypothetical protein
MSRSLIPLLLGAVLLAGCGSLQSVQPIDMADDESSSRLIPGWLQLHAEVRQLTEEEIVEQLVDVGLPEGDEALYYYGLLNQQLNSYGAWIQARDAFSKLAESENLLAGQRELAVVFRVYNQDRINTQAKLNKLNARGNELQERLVLAEEEKRLLQQKIQALTDLESAISTRKEE